MKVAILGLGVVGKGVLEIIRDEIEGVDVKYILEIDKEKIKGFEDLVVTDYSIILDDPEIDAVIELIGGTTIAYDFIIDAIKHKKNVVTANKAVMSKYYEELITLAEKYKVILRYEAAVGGAMMIIDPLLTISQIDTIDKIEGIINGSTNFILTSIFQHDKSLDETIKKAYELGYLETGTNDDMDGLDLMRKINILSIISYQYFIKEEDIIRVPLTSLTSEMIDYIKVLDKTVKYIATSIKENGQVMVHLEPVLLNQDDPFNNVSMEYNKVVIHQRYHQTQSFYGQGAGRYPTGSIVAYDVLKVMNKDIQSITYKANFKINKELRKYDFLVEYKDKISVVKDASFESLMNDKEVVCFVRIAGDI